MHKLLTFKNEKLLRQALTHSSYVKEHPDEETKDNERLEYLGDALLDFICAEYLYDDAHNPEMQEDEMTRRRAALVDQKQLAKFAREIGLDFRMRLSTGAIRDGGYHNPNLLSSTFEAVVAAYYLDNNRNLDIVRDAVIHLFKSVPIERLEIRASVDAKNRFQTLVQAKVGITPYYKSSRCGGADHAPEFLAIAYVGDQEWGKGKGKSKKEAEKQAAEDALSNWEKQEH